jgi:DNA replication protein DnaC
MYMLVKQTIEKLNALHLVGMAKGFEDQLTSAAAMSLSFEDRFSMLVDQEDTHRGNLRLKRLLKAAKLKSNACIEDIDYQTDRGLDKAVISSLRNCLWISNGINLLITGPTGTGKTWLACALGNQACRSGKSVLFQRISILVEELHIGHGDGSFRKRLSQIAKLDLLILDDFGLGNLTQQGRSDILEVIEARGDERSTIITSQLPVSIWHEYLGGNNPTVADAFLDRTISGAIRLEMRGESMRKRRTPI